jgi:hypothetical protein
MRCFALNIGDQITKFGLDPVARQHRFLESLGAPTFERFKLLLHITANALGPNGMAMASAEFDRRVRECVFPEFESNPVPVASILETLSRQAIPPSIEHHKAKNHERPMLEDDRIITKGGVRYFPLSLAAQVAQAPRTTLLSWINARVEFQGRPLQTYNSPTARKSFLDEESVRRVANRFVKWPSMEPAGTVSIGQRNDQSGYIGISKAARTLGVDHHTVWLWTKNKTAPATKLLDVIKCTASDQFYIREKDVSQLKELIPRSGLRRGRRPQRAPS